MRTITTTIVGLLLLVGNAAAQLAGLGALEVTSRLDETFRGELSIVVPPGVLFRDIEVREAGAQDYRRLDVVASGYSFLFDLKGARREAGRYLVPVTTDRPVRDLFVDLVVVLEAGRNWQLRHYPLLLRPAPTDSTRQRLPELARQRTPPWYAAAPAPPEGAEAPVASDTDEPQPEADVAGDGSGEEDGAQGPNGAAPDAEAEASGAAGTESATDAATPSSPAPVFEVVTAPGGDGRREWTVRRGDSLSRIAARVAGKQTIEAMSDKIFELNPGAFIRGNRDLLRADVRLLLPSDATLPAPGPAVADVPPEAARPVADSLIVGIATTSTSGVAPASDRVRLEAPPSLEELTARVADWAEADEAVLRASLPAVRRDMAYMTAAILELANDREVLQERVGLFERRIGQLERLIELRSAITIPAPDGEPGGAGPSAAERSDPALASVGDELAGAGKQDHPLSRQLLLAFGAGIASALLVMFAAGLLRRRRRPAPGDSLPWS